MRARVLATLLALVASACSRKPPDATPDGVVKELVERMAKVDGDPVAAKAAYDLLAEVTRKNLVERARRASAASGRPVKPEDMIAPSRFSLRFTPRAYAVRKTDADHATVEIDGVEASEHARVPCVRDPAGWRVELALPDLPPMERRPDGGT